MRVYNYDEHAEVAEFVPDGNLRVYRRSVVPNRTATLRGHYSRLDRRLVVLYRERDDADLKVFLEGFGVIEFKDDVTAAWQLATRNKAQLSFRTDPPIQIVYRSNYNRIVSHIAAAPDTTREDLDFGLYISNVLKDGERRELLYRELSRPSDAS